MAERQPLTFHERRRNALLWRRGHRAAELREEANQEELRQRALKAEKAAEGDGDGRQLR
jgi:hypothetical protein